VEEDPVEQVEQGHYFLKEVRLWDISLRGSSLRVRRADEMSSAAHQP